MNAFLGQVPLVSSPDLGQRRRGFFRQARRGRPRPVRPSPPRPRPTPPPIDTSWTQAVEEQTGATKEEKRRMKELQMGQPRFERVADPRVVQADWPPAVARQFPTTVVNALPFGDPSMGFLGEVQIAPPTSPWSSALHPPMGGRRPELG